MKAALGTLLTSILFLATPAEACVPVPPPEAQELLSNATYIAKGIVVGESYPDYEAHLVGGGNPTKEPWPSSRMVRLVFTNTIAGPLPSPMEIQAPCDWEWLPKVKDEVVVALYNDRFHFLLPYMVEELAALTASTER